MNYRDRLTGNTVKAVQATEENLEAIAAQYGGVVESYIRIPGGGARADQIIRPSYWATEIGEDVWALTSEDFASRIEPEDEK